LKRLEISVGCLHQWYELLFTVTYSTYGVPRDFALGTDLVARILIGVKLQCQCMVGFLDFSLQYMTHGSASWEHQVRGRSSEQVVQHANDRAQMHLGCGFVQAKRLQTPLHCRKFA
jgi:hypothetical protein